MIVALPFLFILLITHQGIVPNKPTTDYEIVIDFKFQDRPPADRYKANYDINSDEKKKSSGQLPYLKLQIKLLKLGSDEIKIKVINNNGNLVFNRKATLDTPIKLDLGFIDDVKDRVLPHEFTILFFSESKSPVSQIRLIVLEDGTFLVNDEMKGKF